MSAQKTWVAPALGGMVQRLGVCAVELDYWAQILALSLNGCELLDSLLIPLSLSFHLWDGDDGSNASFHVCFECRRMS